MHMTSSEHVSPAVSGTHGTWFLGRPKAHECGTHGKHHGGRKQQRRTSRKHP